MMRLVITFLLLSQPCWGQETVEIAEAEKSVQVPISGGSDVYNFYFQKATGPQTVQQGGPDVQVKTQDGQVVEVQKGEEAEEDVAEVTAKGTAGSTRQSRVDKAFEPPRKRWTARLGIGWLSSFPDQGYILGARYRINRYVDFTGELTVPGKTDSVLSLNLGDGEWNLGATLTPIHINIFGWEALWISFLTGVYSGKRPVANGWRTQLDRQYGFYGGMNVRFNINEKFGIELLTKGSASGNAWALLADFKF